MTIKPCIAGSGGSLRQVARRQHSEVAAPSGVSFPAPRSAALDRSARFPRSDCNREITQRRSYGGGAQQTHGHAAAALAVSRASLDIEPLGPEAVVVRSDERSALLALRPVLHHAGVTNSLCVWAGAADLLLWRSRLLRSCRMRRRRHPRGRHAKLWSLRRPGSIHDTSVQSTPSFGFYVTPIGR